MRRITIYLDTSTLIDAIDSSGTSGSNQLAPYRRLKTLVEKAGKRGFICLSVAHLIEFFRGAPYERVLERGLWLESLNPLWIKTSKRAGDEELIWWLRQILGLSDSDSYSPFSPALLGVMTLPSSAEHVAELLTDPTISGFIRKGYHQGKLPDAGHISSEIFATFHEDRKKVSKDASPEELNRTRRGKFDTSVMMRATELWQEVAGADGSLTANDVVTATNRVLEDPSSIPLIRLSQEVVHELGNRTIRHPSGMSARFRTRFAGSALDVQHLAGAVYCDVFTCDALVDEAIGAFRGRRGLTPQLSVGGCGTPEAFVQSLEEQIERAILSREVG